MPFRVVTRDESSNARSVLADVGRAFRTIVEDFMGWGHDGILKLPSWPLSVPQDFVCIGPQPTVAR
jgi:hypothetical protein